MTHDFPSERLPGSSDLSLRLPDDEVPPSPEKEKPRKKKLFIELRKGRRKIHLKRRVPPIIPLAPLAAAKKEYPYSGTKRPSYKTTCT